MNEKGFYRLAGAIAFSALVAGAVVLEIHGCSTDGLWIFIIFWAFFL